MIRTIFIIMFISLFFMISSYANEYYCPYGDGSFDFNRDIYNTDDGCKQWNTDFWKECDPDLYSNCIKNQAILRKMYFEEKCENILNKIHTENKASCTVRYGAKSKKYISISCKGVTREFRNKVKEMYK